ncbi:MAG: hypothetical protein H6999_08100 [Hahellaceae bacterium]|nr:hypothetical protein [Hahellaceae bacterium]MCP5169705.1 hypothetical protein [Hahellaceae bacterium]
MDMTSILWSLLFGSIGIGYYIYGKRQSQVVVKYTGVSLMVYPYFVSNNTLLVLIGIGLLLLPRFIKP